MSKARLITDNFPNFLSHFQVKANQKKPNMYPTNNSALDETANRFTTPIFSTQGTCGASLFPKLSHSSACLCVSAKMQVTVADPFAIESSEERPFAFLMWLLLFHSIVHKYSFLNGNKKPTIKSIKV